MTHLYDPANRHVLKLKELVSKQDVSEEIRAEVDKINELIQAREEYCNKITSSSSPALSDLMQKTLEHPWEKLHEEGKMEFRVGPRMMSGHLEAQFLKSIVSIAKAKKVLELGLFTGCGALTIAEALPEDGEVYSCEVMPYLAEFARNCLDASPHGRKVKIMNGFAKDTLVKLGEQNLKFDVIFMDADKVNYITYYKLIFEKKLLAPGGTIVVDNALFGGVPYSDEIINEKQGIAGRGIREFNEYVLNDDSIHRVLIPLRDGVMLIRRKEDIGL